VQCGKGLGVGTRLLAEGGGGRTSISRPLSWLTHEYQGKKKEEKEGKVFNTTREERRPGLPNGGSRPGRAA